MRRALGTVLALVWVAAAVGAWHDDEGGCGTTRETPKERAFVHRQALRAGAGGRVLAATAQAPFADRDIGDIAVIEDTDGVVSPSSNAFNLDGMTVAFTPSGAGATHYGYAVANLGYDAAAATNGTPLVALDDDDSRLIALPFPFPFFGGAYNQVYVNSDGNLTFTAGDNASSQRSLGRMTAGPPRISPLFTDLNPAQTAGGVRVFSDASHLVVSWVAVPEYSASGTAAPETFQVKLYANGRIEFSYSGIDRSVAAVVGIAPGNLQGSATLVDFETEASGDYTAAVAEWFSSGQSIDIVTVAQRFYQTHEDAYDYLVIYNNEGIQALPGAISYESTVRSSSTGYGVDAQDDGQLYGSASRLRAVLNMGYLGQYGAVTDPVSGRFGDTPLSILAHEAGHLFLAFASINDPQNPSNHPMIGYQGAHWSFLYDSEASFMEGEKIWDGLSPCNQNLKYRFCTGAQVQQYSPLDQYLMGFGPAANVGSTFVVQNPNPLESPLWHPPPSPQSFDGTRLDVQMDALIQTMGRRTPDYTVAQHRFRFAFILVVPPGSTPSTAQLDTYRQQFAQYYATAAGGNAVADTSLGRSMKLSFFPAAGVVAGTSGTATLTLKTAPAAAMTVALQAPGGHATLPASATIPAGATSVSFPVTGVTTGVEEITATPSGPYETAFARVQVADPSTLKLVVVSGDNQPSPTGGQLVNPVVVRLTDVNNLSYVGASIAASASAGGSVTPGSLATDAQGQASFQWTPGSVAGVSSLTLTLAGAPTVSVAVTAGPAAPLITVVENAASGAEGIAAGALASIEGLNLAGGQSLAAPDIWPTSLGGVSVLLGGTPLQLFFVSDTKISLYAPPSLAGGVATLTVNTPAGTAATATATVSAVQPAIFPGAVLKAGTVVNATTTPVHAGDYIEIYGTGLGPTTSYVGLQWTVTTPTVFIGATPTPAIFSGLAPGFLGLNQVDVQVPSGLTPGPQPIMISVGGLHSNTVNILVQ